ncbi:MAG: hypothetical protein N2511_07840 [Thermodesulfovibrionales bacterium]|nr:hypothetical protein [Thermodesulfovibrionales bacterium]
MLLYKEIRVLYIKFPAPINAFSLKVIKVLWELPKEIPISFIDIYKNEIFVHTEAEFTQRNWDASVGYMRMMLQLFNKKSGFIVIRKISASRSHLKTRLESYKVTTRGVYLSELPNSPELIEDALRFSGRNKRLQFDDFIANIIGRTDNTN